MPFLPVAHRELIAAAHRRSTYRMRWGVALSAAVLAGFFLLLAGFSGARASGTGLFGMVGGLSLLLVGLAGLFLTSDAIAAEHRDGTLQLLHLTELGPFDLLAGKLVGAGIHAACALLALFPVLALSWILGGFTGAEVLRFLLVGLNVLFVSLTVGLAVSAWGQRPGAVVAGTAIVLAALFFWPMLVKLVNPPGAESWAGLSPLECLTGADDMSYRGFRFWRQLAWGHLTGWIALCVAAAGVRRRWRGSNEGARDTTQTRARRRRVLTATDPELLPVQAVQLLLAGHSQARRWAWGAVFLPSLCFLIFLVADNATTALGTFVGTGFAVGLILKGLYAWEAVGPLNEARRVGTLELLLSTPVTDRAVWSAQARHLNNSFLGPFLVLYGLDLLAIGCGIVFWNQGAEMGMAFVGCLMGGLLTLLQCRAMSLGGLWWGLREERPTIAFAKNFLLGTGLSIPLMYFCCAGFVVPLILSGWLSNRLRLPMRVLLTESTSKG